MNRSIVAFVSIVTLLLTSFVPTPQEAQEEVAMHGPSFSLVASPEASEATYAILNEPTLAPAPMAFVAPNDVGNDEKLPLDIIPRTVNDKIGTATNLQYTVSPANAGTFEAVVDPIIDQYFVPTDGFVGAATVTVTGDNKKGTSINGTLVVNVLAGPAVRLEIVPMAPVPK